MTKQVSAKNVYAPPALTVYGCVRDLTGGASGTTGDGTGTLKEIKPSDPALKDNVTRVGEHPAGFGLYLFNYKAEFSELPQGRQFGVMADEVEKIVPGAVAIGENGYREVDYSMLGITLH